MVELVAGGLPFSKYSRVMSEAEFHNLPGEPAGLGYVIETPKGKQDAIDFQSGTTGAFTTFSQDVLNGIPAVPALRYTNPNPRGRDFLKFDGVELGADGSTVLLTMQR